MLRVQYLVCVQEGETPLLRTVNSELGDQIERSKVVNYFVKVKNMDITQLSQVYNCNLFHL